MDKFVIHGGKKLHGEVNIGGSKNAALALMPATLLASGNYRFGNIPDLRDISTMGKLLQSTGVSVEKSDSVLHLNTFRVNKFEAPYEHVKRMRASIYVLGPLVARYGYAKVSLPGGCAWGPRPVNLHIEGIRKLGAEIEIDQGYIIAKAKRLRAAKIAFEVSSVGATGNIMMAAVLAKGTSVIKNAAIEPEITALAHFLVSMGARIEGIGSSKIEIEGVNALQPSDAIMIPDRIEAGTILVAAALTGGTVTLNNVNPLHLAALTEKLAESGSKISSKGSQLTIKASKKIKPVGVSTAIYPGFPTDMQAQWIALMSLAHGDSTVTDTVYFDRFKHVPELIRLGANIEIHNNAARVKGVKRLTGATVMSTDLRASASLVLAGLAAEGTTEVLRMYHLDRGYEHLEKKLHHLGADIRRVAGKEY
ncbi:MAG TPA: UDP-N-acetylglucosamine 1-carboxyvinyltransferase [Bacteroidota bacterium]|nr:UDP-N-acetylglucosamine 1-carboxyvinyltransferase [Bacteroidota bacterium]